MFCLLDTKMFQTCVQYITLSKHGPCEHEIVVDTLLVSLLQNLTVVSLVIFICCYKQHRASNVFIGSLETFFRVKLIHNEHHHGHGHFNQLSSVYLGYCFKHLQHISIILSTSCLLCSQEFLNLTADIRYWSYKYSTQSLDETVSF